MRSPNSKHISGEIRILFSLQQEWARNKRLWMTQSTKIKADTKKMKSPSTALITRRLSSDELSSIEFHKRKFLISETIRTIMISWRCEIWEKNRNSQPKPAHCLIWLEVLLCLITSRDAIQSLMSLILQDYKRKSIIISKNKRGQRETGSKDCGQMAHP